MQTLENILSASSAAFGTSGLRGLVSDLNESVVRAVVQAFVRTVQQKNSNSDTVLYIAHDLRPSSPLITQLAIKEASRLGFMVENMGAVPTPALALAAQYAPFGPVPAIMVTGSHIPFDRNGLKFYTAAGEITKQDEQAILEQNLDSWSLDGVCNQLEKTNQNDGVYSTVARDMYINRCTSLFSDLLTDKRIGLYQHSAVGRDISHEIFSLLGAEVVVLDRSDIFVPIDTEAVSSDDKSQCKVWTAEHKLDAVFSTDGDGDRPLLADENGDYFRGDELGALAALYLQASCVVTPVSSTTAIDKSSWFSKVVRTRIGSPYVLAEMEKAAESQKTVVGFEANGGFLVQQDIPMANGILRKLATRDAMVPVLATMRLAYERKLPLSALRQQLPARFMSSNRLENRETAKSNEFLENLEQNSTEAEILVGSCKHLDSTDGLRFTTVEDEIIHLRPSGNAPEFRIYAEASSQERADELLNDMLGRVAKSLDEKEMQT